MLSCAMCQPWNREEHYTCFSYIRVVWKGDRHLVLKQEDTQRAITYRLTPESCLQFFKDYNKEMSVSTLNKISKLSGVIGVSTMKNFSSPPTPMLTPVNRMIPEHKAKNVAMIAGARKVLQDVHISGESQLHQGCVDRSRARYIYSSLAKFQAWT